MSTEIKNATLVCQFAGISGSGYIAVDGVRAGDIVLKAYADGYGDIGPNYEPFITQDGSIFQKSSGDNSSLTITAVIIR